MNSQFVAKMDRSVGNPEDPIFVIGTLLEKGSEFVVELLNCRVCTNARQLVS